MQLNLKPFRLGAGLRPVTIYLGPNTIRRQLALGLIVLVTCACVFGRLLDDVRERNGITNVDRQLTLIVAAHRHIGLNDMFVAITTIGAPLTLTVITLAASAFLTWRARSTQPVVIALVAMVGARVLVDVLKATVDRQRPSADLAVAAATGNSFPSGHATTSVVAFGILAFMAASRVAGRPGRLAIWSTALALALAIGCSRIYLGVHYLSDVLAAWTVGASWLTVLILATSAASDPIRHPRSPPSP